VVEWLRKIQQQHVEVRQYEHTPLVKIQGWSEVPRGLPLFESVLGFENYPLNDVVEETANRLQFTDVWSYDRNHYPLSIAVIPEPGLLLKITYDTARFADGGIRRMFESLELLLRMIAAKPEATLSELLEAAGRADEERRQKQEREREQSNRHRLMSVRRRAVTGAQEESAL
jgi:non-ribosomal peptide synthetase component F